MKSEKSVVSGKRQKPGGEKFMKLIKAIGLVMFLGTALMAGQQTDTVLLTITPAFNLSVNISSTTGDFGSNVGLGESRTICV